MLRTVEGGAWLGAGKLDWVAGWDRWMAGPRPYLTEQWWNKQRRLDNAVPGFDNHKVVTGQARYYSFLAADQQVESQSDLDSPETSGLKPQFALGRVAS